MLFYTDDKEFQQRKLYAYISKNVIEDVYDSRLKK